MRTDRPHRTSTVTPLRPASHKSRQLAFDCSRRLALQLLLTALTISLPSVAKCEDPLPEWDIIAAFGNSLFPSAIVATSTIQEDEDDYDPFVLGEAYGLLGAIIESPRKNAKVRVEVSSQRFIEPSVFEGTLPKGGKIYEVYPLLRYDYEALLSVRQPVPEAVAVTVSIDGKPLGTKHERMLIRSVNDCPFAIVDENEDVIAMDFLFAAYVNENHPFVDEVLAEALDSGDTDSFAGYQGSADDVLLEMEAVWNALQRRGFAYSSITRASAQDKDLFTQHVRLVGDAVKTSQANCVDGSVLMASVFQKLGLDSFLVSVPGHMFVGVYLDPNGDEFACVETTMLGTSDFVDAVEAGNQQFAEHEEALLAEDGNDPRYSLVEITAAREIGILPLREPDAD